jgi:hypothetical protein
MTDGAEIGRVFSRIPSGKLLVGSGNIPQLGDHNRP